MTTDPAASPQLAASAALAEASRIVHLDPARLHFLRHGTRLRLTVADDRCWLDVTVVRAFPFSSPDTFWSVRDGQSEIGLIVDPSRLTSDDRALLEAELARRYLVPAITRIVSAKERFGTVDWTMETDRGVCRFTTRNLREHVQRPTPGRLVLDDVDGNRYDIRQVDALDRASLALLFRHL